jgi:amino acid adenylation domain-containing protein
MHLHHQFFKSAENQPRSTAVIEESGLKVTYQELKNLAIQFTSCIDSLSTKITNHSGIGILSTIHHQSIAAAIGILNSGNSYIPIDELSPESRITPIIVAAKINLIIIDSALINRHAYILNSDIIKKVIVIGEKRVLTCPENKKIILFSDYLSDTKTNKAKTTDTTICNDQLAYILHTSGSTGTPKGIMLSHKNAVAFIDWMQSKFQLTTKDKIISRAPLKFDLSVFDIFNTLSAGATLICFDWNKPRSSYEKHKDYVSLLEREKVTILYTTPSTLTTLKERGGLGKNKNSLRSIMYAGEPFPIPKLQELRTVLPKTAFFNIYGPTETNIVTYFHIDQTDEELTKWSAVPLGEAAEHCDILVVNEEENRLCKANEIGELWCCGDTVCQGYLHQTELTKSCISFNPFQNAEGRYWKTGDYGFKDQQGILHYRGRKDHLVKINGYRVELGEIESALALIEDIHECCVVLKSITDKKPILYCYYSTKNNKILSDKTIKRSLAHSLPFHMIPDNFIYLNDLPKTSSDKIDRINLTHRA